MGGLFSSITNTFLPTTESYHNRLREIEEEMKAEREKEQRAAFTASASTRSSRWDWGGTANFCSTALWAVNCAVTGGVVSPTGCGGPADATDTRRAPRRFALPAQKSIHG